MLEVLPEALLTLVPPFWALPPAEEPNTVAVCLLPSAPMVLLWVSPLSAFPVALPNPKPARLGKE